MKREAKIRNLIKDDVESAKAHGKCGKSLKLKCFLNNEEMC
jgi:hypothetical protein